MKFSLINEYLFLTVFTMIQMSHIPFIITIILYFISSVWSIGYIVKPGVFDKKVAKWTMMMGFFIHSGFIVFLGLESGNIPITNVYESFVSLLWCILFVYINLDYLYKLPSLDTFLLPVVTALSIWALTFDGGNLLITVSLQNFWLIAHIIPIFVGYAAFTISFSLSIMYLTQQRQLKHKLFGSLFNKLPSLEGIDKMMWKTISFGFPLLTLGLVFGTFWVKTQNVLGEMWYLDYKVILGLATWLIYAALLHMRLIASFHGTKIACLTIVGFCLVLFTFIGTFFMGSKHAFQKVSEQTHTELLNVQ
ncbi:MAG TPA: cytochrome C assembly family protein [Candidatus Wunengus sp. YC65]|uniref:cytochrome C assembly family protein n=1 Tax=Candidatus Wunengus sp. YC65 TaxID=3367701 RepID=UPI004029A636